MRICSATNGSSLRLMYVLHFRDLIKLADCARKSSICARANAISRTDRKCIRFDRPSAE